MRPDRLPVLRAQARSEAGMTLLELTIVIGLLIDWLFLSVSFGIVCSAVMVR